MNGKAITKNTDKNIVSGQSIARNEFGIEKGLFWSDKGNFLAFYQKDETEVADYPLLDVTTTPGSLISIKYPMAGQKSEKPRVGIYNCKTKNDIWGYEGLTKRKMGYIAMLENGVRMIASVNAINKWINCNVSINAITY